MSTQLIKRLEEERGSKVIVYMTSDKGPPKNDINLTTKVAIDVFPLFREILESFSERPKKISLVLNTLGGNIDTPWPLVNLIREYSDSFEVIVADDALSAGTLISLGADSIVMLPHSHLSPIDPAREFIDSEKKERQRMEIEDIVGYIDFLKSKAKINKQDSMAELVRELTKEVRPTILGSANRAHSLIRSLAEKLISLNGSHSISARQRKKIVNHLTSTLYAHNHRINRLEARDYVGFGKDIIEFASKDTESLVKEIDFYFRKKMELDLSFRVQEFIGSHEEKKLEMTSGIVHSGDIRYNFIYRGNFQKKVNEKTKQVGIQVPELKGLWEKS